MKPLMVLAAAFALPLPGFAQDAKPLVTSQIPQRAAALTQFVPHGWMVEKTVRGDLNRDKIPDAALVLVEKEPPTQELDEGEEVPLARALLVLSKQGTRWRRAGFNNSLLLGTREGGALFGVVETPVNLSIENGVLLVTQRNGSREVTKTTYKFRLDRRKQHFTLIGLEVSQSDRLINGGRRESFNYLTGVKRTTLIQGENERETTKTSRVSRKLRSLESVKVEKRYAG